MIRLKGGKQIAVIENGQAVIKTENVCKIKSVSVDHADKIVYAVLEKGYINSSNEFVKTGGYPNPVSIRNIPETKKDVIVPEAERTGEGLEMFKSVTKAEVIPVKPMYDNLVTPKQGQTGRWKGDFRLKDVEIIIKDNNLLEEEIDQIVEQS